jgi:hypothetical protein
VKAKNAYFDDQQINVDLKTLNSLQADKAEFKSLKSLTRIVAKSFDVCGQVKVIKNSNSFSNLPRSIQIRCYEQQGDQLKLTSSTNLDENLAYCLRLNSNVNYILKAEVTDDELAKVLKLVPLERKVTVVDSALFEVNFEQLEARLEGKINLLGTSLLSDLSLTLKSADPKRQWHAVITPKCQEEKVVNQSSKITCSFSITNLLFGEYVLTSNYDDLFCWNNVNAANVVSITVNSELQRVQIDQTGYRLNYRLSHRNAMLKLVDASKNVLLSKNIINEQDLSGQVCLPRIADYSLQIDSCHLFSSESGSENLVKVSAGLFKRNANTLTLSAQKHLTNVDISFKFEDLNDRKSLDQSDLLVEVRRANGEQVEQEIKFKLESESANEVVFRARAWLESARAYTLQAKSNKVLFESNNKDITVNDQRCELNQVRFDAKLGIFMVVSVTPKDIDSIDVVLKTTNDNTVLSTNTISSASDFQLGPLRAPFSQYSVELVKSGYLFAKTASSSNKNVYRSEFSVEKLGQLKVSVVDAKLKTGLESVLLSLSSENRLFRQTIKTDANGQASFDNLKPSLYYLILMMQGNKFNFNKFQVFFFNNHIFLKNTNSSQTRIRFKSQTATT